MAIIFSIVFAAIAVIASGGESGYIAFLEEDGGFTKLLYSFKLALNILFTALLISLAEFGYTVARINSEVKYESKAFMSVYIFILLYALIAARLMGNDAIMFAKSRADFAVGQEAQKMKK